MPHLAQHKNVAACLTEDSVACFGVVEHGHADLVRDSLEAEAVLSGLLHQLTTAHNELERQNASLRAENELLKREQANGTAKVFPADERSTTKQTADADLQEAEPPEVSVVRSEPASFLGTEGTVSEAKNSQGPSTATYTLSSAWRDGGQQQSSRLGRFLNSHDEPDLIEDKGLTESTAAGPSHWCIGSPGSPIRLTWDLIGFAFILYDMIMIPLKTFSPPDILVLEILDWTILIFWTLNVGMSCTVGYVYKGHLVMTRGKILLHYLKTWFVLDLAVLVPDWFLTIQSLANKDNENAGSSAGEAVKMLRILRLTKCFRLLRAAKLKKMLQTITDEIDSEFTGIVVNLLKMIALLLIINHFIASLWYAVGTLDSDESWVKAVQYEDREWYEKYLLSYHWGITQFTPASKVPVQPVNIGERLFAIFVVIFALVGFAYIVGSITGSLTQLRAMAEDADKQFYQVRRYLRQNEVTQSLRSRIIRFLEHAYAKSRSRADAQNIRIFGLLSESLRSELRLEIVLPLLKVHPFLLRLSVEFMPTLQRIASCIGNKILSVGEVLFFPGEKATHMYFLEMGQLKYLRAEQNVQVVEQKANWIAEPALWTSWIHLGRAMAVMESDVMIMNPKSFADMVTLSPAAFELVATYAANFVAWMNSQISDITDIFDSAEMFDKLSKFLPDAPAFGVERRSSRKKSFLGRGRSAEED